MGDNQAMNPDDLLNIAEKLVAGGIISTPGHPSDMELRRAISCTYYALFHTLCRCCADELVGQNPTGPLASEKWEQAYRSPDHGAVKDRCNKDKEIQKFPSEIQDFANLLVERQRERHEADYNPNATFTNSAVQQSITEARDTIARFNSASTNDRRSFAVYLLLKIRRS